MTVRSSPTGGARTCKRFVSLAMFAATVWLGACRSTLPSARLHNRIDLPVPAFAETAPRPDRLFGDGNGAKLVLTPLQMIRLAFDLQPDIKSSFQRFKSEEARYDFFYVSRDSLTPRLRMSNRFDEVRDTDKDAAPARSVSRSRDHSIEFSVEKRFFDTTALDVGLGYAADDVDDDIGDRPFVSADLRYPLWASRQKLERASEDIFRQNELNDTQLGYIQEVRSRLENAMFRFHDVAHLGRRVDMHRSWLDDLDSLVRVLPQANQRDKSVDSRRLQAEIAKVSADLRIAAGWFDIQLARLKAAIGMPFQAELVIVEDAFNPFSGMSHEEVLRASIHTDPEIATLRNATENAEVQLDLAQRGTWDIAFLLSGTSALEGRGRSEGDSDWSVSAGVDVSAVDRRVPPSLIRQARANIHRFSQAIAARENAIFVDTLEPLVRIDTLGESREELIQNLPRYKTDFRTGMDSYVAGALNIDDLLSRRETLFQQEDSISNLTFLLGANVAELCAATGKFFEFLANRGATPAEAMPGEPAA